MFITVIFHSKARMEISISWTIDIVSYTWWSLWSSKEISFKESQISQCFRHRCYNSPDSMSKFRRCINQNEVRDCIPYY